MASHDTFGSNGVPLNRREVLTLTGAASAVATTQAFTNAVSHWPGAVGQSFHVCSPAAVSMIGYAESVASWYGREACVRFLPWEEWRSSMSEKDARVTWDHIARSPSYSIEKARRLLDYQPAYRSLQAIHESLSRISWLPVQVSL